MAILLFINFLVSFSYHIFLNEIFGLVFGTPFTYLVFIKSLPELCNLCRSVFLSVSLIVCVLIRQLLRSYGQFVPGTMKVRMNVL